MAITTTIRYTADLDQAAARESLHDPLFMFNSKAHTFAVSVLAAGATASLSKASCRAWFIRADGVTVPVDGSISGNVASVTLLPNCYAVPGRFSLSVELTLNDVIHTILHVDGTVLRTRTDSLTAGGSAVQSFDDLVSAVQHVDAENSRRDRRYNHLYNSNLADPIRIGESTVFTGSGYGIEGWRTNFSGDTVEVTGSGTKNTVKGTDKGWHLHQILNNCAGMAGKSFTAAFQADAVTGSLYLMLSCRDINDQEISHADKQIVAGVSAVSLTVPEGTEYLRVGVFAYPASVSAGDSVTLQWAALYEGAYTAATLPDYQPKGYLAELAACRWYHKRYHTTSSSYAVCLNGYFSNSGKDIVVGMPANMRVKPTVTLTGAIAVRDANGYVIDLSGHADTLCSSTGNWANEWASLILRKADGTAWGGTNNSLCSVCLTENSVLDFSAVL